MIQELPASNSSTPGTMPVLQEGMKHVSVRRSEVVFVGIPTYDQMVSAGTMMAAMMAGRGVRCAIKYSNASLLACNFNILLSEALNLREQVGLTHFLLLHADVVPHGETWLETMLNEMERHHVQVLSAVIPIKDHRGLTSTALDTSGLKGVEPWRCRRLTLAECDKLPVTFDGREAAAGIEYWPKDLKPVLLVNTGLMLIDLRAKWVDDVCFTVRDQIGRDAEGRRTAYCEPEDWGFSKWLHAKCIPYKATRCVAVGHDGSMSYESGHVWGTEQIDPVYLQDVDRLVTKE